MTDACLLQELTETRHNLNEVQQHLQDSTSQAAQQEQQHSKALARLTQDLQQEQQARSGLYSTHVELIITRKSCHCQVLHCCLMHVPKYFQSCSTTRLHDELADMQLRGIFLDEVAKRAHVAVLQPVCASATSQAGAASQLYSGFHRQEHTHPDMQM